MDVFLHISIKLLRHKKRSIINIGMSDPYKGMWSRLVLQGRRWISNMQCRAHTMARRGWNLRLQSSRYMAMKSRAMVHGRRHKTWSLAPLVEPGIHCRHGWGIGHTNRSTNSRRLNGVSAIGSSKVMELFVQVSALWLKSLC